jgi:pimeloyl-ACP methyl ester carboxylesterase
MFRAVLPGLILLAAATVGSAADPYLAKTANPAGNAPPPDQGEIAGAKYTIARPVFWNRRLLMIAHGLRPDPVPLSTGLLPLRAAYQALFDQGWMIAMTSYRRNGMIIADAVADIDGLRDYIEQTYGRPDRVLIEGESMGGLIVTLIAERTPDPDAQGRPLYSGAVAIDAALSAHEANSTIGLSLQPKMPVIFLATLAEFEGPARYVQARVPHDVVDIRPVLFRVSRDGHANVNQRERLAALNALNAWLDSGRAAVPHPAAGEAYFDATIPPEPQPSQVTAQPDSRGFTARVSEIAADYGNVVLNAQPGDFAAAGIRPMTWFQLTAGDKTYRVRYGHDFGSVKHGEWVAFPDADGFTLLARNLGDAAATAGLAAGASVGLRRYDEPQAETAVP